MLGIRRSALLGVAVAVGVAVTAQPGYAATGCGGAGSSTPLTISGPDTRTTTYGSSYTVAGTAPAGQSLDVSFHGDWNNDVENIVRLTASCDGTWRVPGTANDQYSIRAMRGQTTTRTVRVQIAPTISGPATHVVPKGSTYTIRGTGAPGAMVSIHFHKAGTASNDYSIVRSVPVNDGAWSRPYTASVDYRFYATLPNGQRSQNVLVQAR